MKTKKILRSQEWFGGNDKMGFVHRSWFRNQGYPDDYFRGRPVIGICNTWSDLTPCNGHLRDLAEVVKRGVLEAGGVPFEFPVMSLGETVMKPTTMLFRNLVSMDVEESIRANPLDGVVLLNGCDKTSPSTIMGACSVDLPTIVVPGGPMLNGRYKGEYIGSGSFNWMIKEKQKKDHFSVEDLAEAEVCAARSAGHCNTMGTASSMASMAEALGLTLPGASTIPAVDSRKKVMAQLSGRRIVEMVNEDLKLSHILTRKAFENAIITNAAVGGSTNLIIHLIAIARRIGVEVRLEDFDHLGSKIPLLVNLMPSGKYLMEDFYYAGGLPVVFRELEKIMHNDAKAVNGKTFKENYKEFCERTIPHEVAHIIAFQIFGTKGHDYAWRRIMNDFGCDSTRCHSYDTENSTVRTIKKQYPYKCGCTTHMLTKIRHNRSIKHGGEAYRCRKCGQVLVYIPGDTK